jgi:FemAB-related protein (PEP-CTERM system-associated)
VNAPLLSAPVAIVEARLDDPRDAARIGLFVRDEEGGTPFHLPEWSTAIEAGCGQQARYLTALDASGAVVGVLPLTYIRSRLFGTALVSAGFGVGGGILAASSVTARALADEAWRLACDAGASTLELRGGPAPDGFQTDCDTYLGFVRPLARDDEGELKAIPRKQRAELRKGLELGLKITTGNGARDRKAHAHVYGTSVRNLGTPVFPRALFRQVLRAFGSSADILTVWQDDRPVASVLSLYWNGTVYPYWGGGTAAARPLRANDVMYFSLMQHARDRGCTRFDFGRSKAGTGAAAFKRNWGFTPEPLAYHVRTADGAAPRQVNPLDPKYARRIALWKRLPLPIANTLGPIIARGLG